MTVSRHGAVAEYLVSEGGLPWATPLPPYDRGYGQPEGQAIALPEPFESAVVIGVVRDGLRGWAAAAGRRARLLIIRRKHDRNLSRLTVEVPLGTFVELTRAYYERKAQA